MSTHKKIIAIFVAMFFFSLNVAITGYVNSSLMESIGWSNGLISSLYIFAAACALILFPTLPKITNRIGNGPLLITLLSASLVSIIAMVSGLGKFTTAAAFSLFLINNFLIIFEMDVFLNHFSKKQETGRIRGLFYTVINLTWLLAPLIASHIIEQTGFRWVYLIAGGAIVASGAVASIYLVSSNDFEKRSIEPTFKVMKRVYNNSNLTHAFVLSTLLHIFYSFSVIYIPLYLVQVIGLSWIQIGTLLLIANIPFIILGYPIGKLADHIGEKTIIITGIIISLFGIIGFISLREPHLFAWAILFFVNRTGIAMLETSIESFTFKQIDPNDQALLGIQRDAVPLGYIISPAIGYVVSLMTDSYLPIFMVIAGLFTIALYPAFTMSNPTSS